MRCVLPHVYCRFCGTVVGLSRAFVTRKVAKKQTERTSVRELSSRLFRARCRSCHEEAIYTLGQIIPDEDRERREDRFLPPTPAKVKAMTVKPVPGCRICALGDDCERVLIAIKRDPRASKTRIIRDMHVTRSPQKQREIFENLPFEYRDGRWVDRETTTKAATA